MRDVEPAAERRDTLALMDVVRTARRSSLDGGWMLSPGETTRKLFPHVTYDGAALTPGREKSFRERNRAPRILTFVVTRSNVRRDEREE